MEQPANPRVPFLDNIPEEPGKRTLVQFLELFVGPELERRKVAGIINDSFVVMRAQAVLYPDGREPTVRFNEELAGVAVARLSAASEGKLYTDGTPLYIDEIEAFERFELPEAESDCGHITMLITPGKVALFFDARRNRGRARLLLKRAQEFFETAESARKEKHLAVFVDNLFSAAELAVKAWLWTGPAGFEFVERMRHRDIGSAFQTYAGWGNAHPRMVKTYNELTAFRPQLRYGTAAPRLRQAVTRRWLEDVRGMIKRAGKAVRSTLEDDMAGSIVRVPVAPR